MKLNLFVFFLFYIGFSWSQTHAQKNNKSEYHFGLPDEPNKIWRMNLDSINIKTYYENLKISSTLSPIFSTHNWAYIGPPNANSLCGAGRVNTILQHPTNPNILWAGSASGGIWKSVDGGLSWQPKSDNFSSLGVSKLLYCPKDTNKMYCATGDAVGGDAASFGLIKSLDGGNTWVATGLSFSLNSGEFIRDFIIQKDSVQNFIVLTNQHIYFSSDTANSFSVKKNSDFYNVAVHPTNSSILYSTAYSGKLFKSINAGRTWTQINGITNDVISKYRVATSSASPNSVFLSAVKVGTDSVAIITSNNMGLTWSQKPYHNIAQQFWYNFTLHINPTNTNEIYFGAVWNWKSTDGGVTFNAITQWAPVHCDHHTMYLAPNGELFNGNDGGIWKTNDGGVNWANLNNNLGALQFYKMSVCNSDTASIGAGAQDNCFVYKTAGTGYNWKSDVGGDIMEVIINPLNSAKIYVMGVVGLSARSIDGGVSWISAPNPGDPLPVGTGNWITPLQVNRQNPKSLYAGFTDVWKSVNDGANWQKISNGLSTNSNIDQLAVAPSDSNKIYAANGIDFYASFNNGNTWTTFSNVSGSSLQISSIAVNPLNSQDVIITFEGFSSNKKVYRSLNGGFNWISLSLNIPNIQLLSSAFGGDPLNSIWIGSESGIFYKNDTMNVWRKPGNFLPNTKVTDIEVMPNYKTVYISSYGRGMWKLNYGTLASSIIPLVSNVEDKAPLVFPTVVSRELNVSADDLNWNYKIYSIDGKALSANALKNRQINVEHLNDGLYVLRLENYNHVYNMKFIVKH